MAGTLTGGKNAAKTNKERHGKDFYAKIGRKGGSVKGIKGFAAMPREKAVAAGRVGGMKSKRGKETYAKKTN